MKGVGTLGWGVLWGAGSGDSRRGGCYGGEGVGDTGVGDTGIGGMLWGQRGWGHWDRGAMGLEGLGTLG